MNEIKIVLLPGDGIGPEVTQAAQTILEGIASQFNHQFMWMTPVVMTAMTVHLQYFRGDRLVLNKLFRRASTSPIMVIQYWLPAVYTTAMATTI